MIVEVDRVSGSDVTVEDARFVFLGALGYLKGSSFMGNDEGLYIVFLHHQKTHDKSIEQSASCGISCT